MTTPSVAAGETILTLPEVARMLRVPEATVRWWRHVGTGPKGFTVGRYVRYRLSDVTAFIDAQLAGEQS